MKKKPYQTLPVQKLTLTEAVILAIAGGCIVALDVAKTKMVGVIADVLGRTLATFRFSHPTETQHFIALMSQLRASTAEKITVGMEPTGVYADALRGCLHREGFSIVMVSPKHTHDMQEIFDGVPSGHDPKSAMIVAELVARGKAAPYVPPPEARVRLRAVVDERRFVMEQSEGAFGLIESMTMRHWPESQVWMFVRRSRSFQHLLVEVGGPEQVAAQPERAKEVLRSRSRSRLAEVVIDETVASAKTTLGVPMVPEDLTLLRRVASALLQHSKSLDELDERMAELVELSPAAKALAPLVGTYTAAVLTTMLDPLAYADPRQMEKAAGLNLRHHSSGEFRGQLHITKRGPGLARQLLYLLALRLIHSDANVCAWYKKRKSYRASEPTNADDGAGRSQKKAAIVAVMRKLVRALWHVARGNLFDSTRLFDTTRLSPVDVTPSTFVAPRTTPRRASRRGVATKEVAASH